MRRGPAERGVIQNGLRTGGQIVHRQSEEIGTRQRLVRLHMGPRLATEIAAQEQNHPAIEGLLHFASPGENSHRTSCPDWLTASGGSTPALMPIAALESNPMITPTASANSGRPPEPHSLFS